MIDRASAPAAVENGDAELAAEQLMAMGTDGAAASQSDRGGWLYHRFMQVR